VCVEVSVQMCKVHCVCTGEFTGHQLVQRGEAGAGALLKVDANELHYVWVTHLVQLK